MSGLPRLAHFPISFFATVMGLSGLTIAWEKAEAVLGLDLPVSRGLLVATGGVFVLLLLLYAAKLARHANAVSAELRHPVKLSFFPTISISLLLLSIATLHALPVLSEGLWLVGAAAHLAFTLYVMGVWINHTHFDIQHLNPAWFIPVVGNIVVPVAGVSHGYVEVSWFFFSIGLLFWLVLLVIVFYRVIFHHPLPDRLVPTFFILIAPPAVGFIAYVRLSDGIDDFARVLYYAGLFLTLLLFTQVTKFTRLKFFLSWWAYSFPLAAITIATFLIFEQTGKPFFLGLGLALWGILSAVLLALIGKTVAAIMRREICVEE